MEVVWAQAPGPGFLPIGGFVSIFLRNASIFKLLKKIQQGSFIFMCHNILLNIAVAVFYAIFSIYTKHPTACAAFTYS
jgi:hypothetical protein